MFALLTDLIIICLVLLGLTMICTVWGRATFRLIGVSNVQNFDCGTLWLGLAAILALTEFLHLFMPIDWRVSAIVLIVSLLSLLSNKNRLMVVELRALLNDVRLNYFKTSIIFLIALIWCLRAMGLSNNFDSGLYHFGSIRWVNEYPLVPGLGNVHWRLALNQSYFGFLSLVNIYPLWNKGYAVGGLFVLFLTSYSVITIASKQGTAWRWLIGGTIFIYFGYIAGTLPNPAPDTAVGLFEVVIFLLFFRMIKNTVNDHAQNIKDSLVILFLSFSLVTIKLSSVVFATTSAMIVLYLQYAELKNSYRQYQKLFIFLFLLGGVHILRGYLLSGLPLFPSTFAGGWQLDWAVPIELVKFETNLIYSWGRVPGEMEANQVLDRWDWIASWLGTVSLFDRILFCLATILMVSNFILSQKKNAQGEIKGYLLLYFPILMAFIFWFFTAPDIRFLGAVPALYFGLSLWIFTCLLKNIHPFSVEVDSHRYRYLYVITTLIVCVMSLKLTGLRSLSFQGWTPIPDYSVTVDKTLTDLSVNVSAKNGQCWNAPLPCVSIFNGNLHADPFKVPWPLSLLIRDRFFYSVKFLNLQK